MEDSRDFTFSYPVWILAPKGRVELAEIGKGYGALGEIKNAGKYVPVFTEQRFAERYIKDSNADSASVGQVADAETFAIFLKNVRNNGCTYLLVDHVYDATPLVKFSLLEIDDVLRDIQNGN
jgi:hypothetical protein